MKTDEIKTHTTVSTILAALLFCYAAIFILYYMVPESMFIEFDTVPKVLTEFKYVIPIFILAISNTMYLGRCAAIDDVETLNYRYINALELKKKELIRYVNLSRIVTKTNSETLVKEFIENLDKI